MFDLSLVILNYKQKGLVKQCVKGILTSNPRLNCEIIVVDNNSGDNCLPEIENFFKQKDQANHQSLFKNNGEFEIELVTIQASGNDGFAVGNNLGMLKAKGKYVAVLNPDIAVVPGALEKMYEFMENNPAVGILGPKLINPDGSVQDSCRRFPSLVMPIYRRSFLGKLPWGKQGLKHYLMTDFNHSQNITTDWLFGAFLFIRKSLLEKIGFFDERFFMYFEDLDLCRRCWEAGSQVYYLASVEMVHYHNRLSAEKTGVLGIFTKAGRIHLSSGIKYFAKYFGAKLPNRPQN